MKLIKKIMAVALAGAMALAGMAVVNSERLTVEAADSVLPTNSPMMSVAKSIATDGAVTVTLSWKSETMRVFDYGVLFDETKLDFVNMEVAPAFLEAYEWNGTSQEGGVPAWGEVRQGEESYITLGGVYYGTEKFNGEVATLHFQMKEGASGAGILAIVKDSTTYDSIADMKAAKPMKKVDLDSDVMMGDVNGDDKVNSDDAVIVLKYFADLKDDEAVKNMNMDAADVNGDSKTNSDDAVEILKKFAGLPSALD